MGSAGAPQRTCCWHLGATSDVTCRSVRLALWCVGVPESQGGGRHRPRREAQPQLVGNPALSPAQQCRHTRGAQAETSPESRSKTGPDLHGPPVANPISFPSPLSPELMELFKVLRTDFSSHP